MTDASTTALTVTAHAFQAVVLLAIAYRTRGRAKLLETLAGRVELRRSWVRRQLVHLSSGPDVPCTYCHGPTESVHGSNRVVGGKSYHPQCVTYAPSGAA